MGKKTKVVIDTNVLISALGWHGKPEEVVNLVTAGRIKNFISLEMLVELRNVRYLPIATSLSPAINICSISKPFKELRYCLLRIF